MVGWPRQTRLHATRCKPFSALRAQMCKYCKPFSALRAPRCKYCKPFSALRAPKCKYCKPFSALRAPSCKYCKPFSALRAQRCKYCKPFSALRAPCCEYCKPFSALRAPSVNASSGRAKPASAISPRRFAGRCQTSDAPSWRCAESSRKTTGRNAAGANWDDPRMPGMTWAKRTACVSTKCHAQLQHWLYHGHAHRGSTCGRNKPFGRNRRASRARQDAKDCLGETECMRYDKMSRPGVALAIPRARPSRVRVWAKSSLGRNWMTSRLRIQALRRGFAQKNLYCALGAITENHRKSQKITEHHRT